MGENADRKYSEQNIGVQKQQKNKSLYESVPKCFKTFLRLCVSSVSLMRALTYTHMTVLLEYNGSLVIFTFYNVPRRS